MSDNKIYPEAQKHEEEQMEAFTTVRLSAPADLLHLKTHTNLKKTKTHMYRHINPGSYRLLQFQVQSHPDLITETVSVWNINIWSIPLALIRDL